MRIFYLWLASPRHASRKNALQTNFLYMIHHRGENLYKNIYKELKLCIPLGEAEKHGVGLVSCHINRGELSHMWSHTHNWFNPLCRFVNVSHWIYLKLLKRLVSQWPYLVHHHPIAPHITLCGVLLVQNSFGSCPLDRNHTSFGFVVVVFIQVMGHAKVSNLWTRQNIWILCYSQCT